MDSDRGEGRVRQIQSDKRRVLKSTDAVDQMFYAREVDEPKFDRPGGGAAAAKKLVPLKRDLPQRF